jgi:ribose 5-phosphate isomerase B
VDITVGCDHGGLELKQEIIEFLVNTGHKVSDVGCHTEDSVDYPHFADKVCSTIIEGQSTMGILICGTGIGMSIAANRHRQIRAALCHEAFTARMSREHNDANVLCLGGRVLGVAIALDIVKVWIETKFSGGRHLRRITMMG